MLVYQMVAHGPKKKSSCFCEFSQNFIGINQKNFRLSFLGKKAIPRMENIETFWVVELRGEDMCLIVFGHPGDCTMLCPYFLDMGVSENSVPLNPMVNDHYPY